LVASREGWRRTGAVASPHWLASVTGRRVLDSGGNAVDACIAMNTVLAVAYPHMCGPGGDLFLLYYQASTRQIFALNGSGRAPLLASRAEFLGRGLESVPVRGPLSVTVPGAVHAWMTASERFGSWNVSRLLEPAIEAAAEGVEITDRLAGWIAANRADVLADRTLRSWFFDSDGEPLPAGATFVPSQLAETLGRIADRGCLDFYVGDLAREIDRAVREADGLLRFEDLAHHQSTWEQPIHASFGELDLYTTPPNSQGILTLQMLNLLRIRNEDGLTPGTAAFVDALVRAKKIAFADRKRYLGDPAFVDVPVAAVLSDEHTREIADGWIARDRAALLSGDTVYMCAVDGERNVCSLIQSIYYAFGSAFVAGDTGVVLHNRGHYFSLDEGDRNVIASGKRPIHTLMASIGLRSGSPWLTVGTMGADGQPQTTAQVVLRLLAGQHPRDAVCAPRFLSGRFLLEDGDDELLIEEDHGPETIDALRDLGHAVRIVPALDERMGHAHAIVARPDGSLDAGSDSRSDGEALVFPL
jgi:gamma-glutamyltranspeptidase/glutathione hydrolase